MSDHPRSDCARGFPTNDWQETAERLFALCCKLERENRDIRTLLEADKTAGKQLIEQLATAKSIAEEAAKEIAALKQQLEAHAWDISPAMAHAKIEHLTAQLAALRDDRASMDWLAQHSNLVAHPINYRSDWEGDFRKRIKAYREILGNRRPDIRDEAQS